MSCIFCLLPDISFFPVLSSKNLLGGNLAALTKGLLIKLFPLFRANLVPVDAAAAAAAAHWQLSLGFSSLFIDCNNCVYYIMYYVCIFFWGSSTNNISILELAKYSSEWLLEIYINSGNILSQ